MRLYVNTILWKLMSRENCRKVPLISSGIFHIPTGTVWDFLQFPLAGAEHVHFQRTSAYSDGEIQILCFLYSAGALCIWKKRRWWVSRVAERVYGSTDLTSTFHTTILCSHNQYFIFIQKSFYHLVRHMYGGNMYYKYLLEYYMEFMCQLSNGIFNNTDGPFS